MGKKKISEFNSATPASGDKFLIEKPDGTYKKVDFDDIGGAVETVSGAQVDNADPLNPIVNTPNLQSVTDEGSSTTNELQLKDGSNNVVAVLGSNQFDILNDVVSNSLFNVDRITNTVVAKTPPLYNSTEEVATTKFVRDNSMGCIYRNHTDTTPLTGTTVHTLVDDFLLDANVMEVGYDLSAELNANKDLDNGTFTIRMLYNTSASLSGATTLATYTSVAATNQVNFIRNFGCKSPTVTELMHAPTINVNGDYEATSNSPVTVLNIDWTQPIYILWSLQNSSALDTTVISKNKLWKK